MVNRRHRLEKEEEEDDIVESRSWTTVPEAHHHNPSCAYAHTHTHTHTSALLSNILILNKWFMTHGDVVVNAHLLSNPIYCQHWSALATRM